jgi:hypothetical protein
MYILVRTGFAKILRFQELAKPCWDQFFRNCATVCPTQLGQSFEIFDKFQLQEQVSYHGKSYNCAPAPRTERLIASSFCSSEKLNLKSSVFIRVLSSDFGFVKSFNEKMNVGIWIEPYHFRPQ